MRPRGREEEDCDVGRVTLPEGVGEGDTGIGEVLVGEDVGGKGPVCCCEGWPLAWGGDPNVSFESDGEPAPV